MCAAIERIKPDTRPAECEALIGIFVSHDTGEVVPARCKRWGCPYCGPRRARRFMARVVKQSPLYLASLTMPADAGEPTKENIYRINSSWRAFSRWLKRNAALHDYTWVNEIGEKGRLHKHALLDCRRFSYARARAAVRRAGFGAVCDFKRVSSKRGASRYVGKYLAKHLSQQRWPRYSRRAQTTTPDERKPNGTWEFKKKARFVGRRKAEVESPGLPFELALEPDEPRQGRLALIPSRQTASKLLALELTGVVLKPP